MANTTVNINELNEAIANVLDEYNADLIKDVKKTTNRAMKDLVKRTKETAPVGNRSKHYRDSISSKTLEETRYGIKKVWYVRGSDYRLSHLLNNGHALRDGGRYQGTNFIGNAVDDILPWYLSEIEEACKK